MVRVQCTDESGAEEEGAAEEEDGGVGSSEEASSICTSFGWLSTCQPAAMAAMTCQPTEEDWMLKYFAFGCLTAHIETIFEGLGQK